MVLSESAELVVVGKITGLFGVRGWVKLFSHTDPRENILRYQNWFLQGGGEPESFELEQGKRHGKTVIAKLHGIEDREQAAGLIGRMVMVERSAFAALDADEFYWADLIGLQVVTEDGIALGVVDHLLETGANDVLVVMQDGRERLIPYIRGEVIKQVDRTGRRIIVDWDPEF